MRLATVVLIGLLAAGLSACGDDDASAPQTTLPSFAPATVGVLPTTTSTTEASTTLPPVPTFTVPVNPPDLIPTTTTTAPPPPPSTTAAPPLPPTTDPPPPRPTTTVPEWTKHPEVVPLCTATVLMQNDGSKLVNAVHNSTTSVATLDRQFDVTMKRMTDLLPLAPPNVATFVQALHDAAIAGWEPVLRAGSRAEAQARIEEFLTVINQPLLVMVRALDVSCPGRLASPQS